MKPAALLLILLLSGIARAQDWAPLSAPGVKRYFTNKNQYLRGMRVDSVTADGGAEVYHLFRSLRGNLTSYSLDPNGASWLGNNVRKEEDGRWLFPTWLSDTIVIKPGAVLGETWRMYDDSGTTAYDVTVTALDTATVLGALDSVKTLTIAALPASGLPADDSLHGWTIVLSKAHGFVQVPDVWMWPYHRPGLAHDPSDDAFLSVALCSDPNGSFCPADYDDIAGANFRVIDFLNPRQYELHNFQAGDAFRVFYEDWGNGPSYYAREGEWIDSIISVVVYPDSVVQNIAHYERKRSLDVAGTPITLTYTRPVTTQKSTRLFSEKYMPEEYGNSLLMAYNPLDSQHCFVSSAWTTSSAVGADFICLSGLCYPTEEVYKLGFGKISHSWYGGDGGRYTLRLQASLKNGAECGIIGRPQPLTADNFYSALVAISPNPARSTITIFTPDLIPVRIILTDATGRGVLQTTPRSSRTEISIAHLPPGLYLLTAFDKTGARHTARVTIAP